MRTIVVLIVALAVAVLPFVGGAMRVAKAMEGPAMPAAMAAADQPCEHAAHSRDHAAQPCDQDRHDADDCGSTAACAAKCFNFAGLTPCDISYAPAGTMPVATSAPAAFVSHTDPPPFPPPRI